MSHHPALLMVPAPTSGSRLPHPDEVRKTIQGPIVDTATWVDKYILLDVRREQRDIQDEVPPADPYETTANVIILRQIGTDMRTVAGARADPLTELIKGLYREFDAINIWVDTAEIGGS